jgi:hypothetical protein
VRAPSGRDQVGEAFDRQNLRARNASWLATPAGKSLFHLDRDRSARIAHITPHLSAKSHPAGKWLIDQL